MKQLHSKLSYANVMATIAVFVALGGSSYAALRVNSSDIVDNSVRSVDVRDRSLRDRDVATNALTGRNIAEGRLGRVPSARVAGRLTGAGSNALKLRCPAGTELAAGLCFETSAHGPLTYETAARACGAVNVGNRRLADPAELVAYFASGGDIAPDGELTSSVFESRAAPGRLDVVVLKTEAGDAAFAPAVPLEASGGVSVRLPYRCVTTPTNVP
jgi:hypothetical protein